LHIDKDSCQYAIESCQEMEKWYSGIVSKNIVPSFPVISRKWEKRVVYQDKQSVTLALTIAKVCGVKVEDVFYLEEEENKEK